MVTSSNLLIPFLAAAQSQKHVTVNEAFAVLDAVVQCAVLDMARNDPPEEAPEGDRYLVGPTPSGRWAFKAGKLACWENGGWIYLTPKPGWQVYDLSNDTLHVMTADGTWVDLTGAGTPPTELANLARFGLGAAASTQNPFVAKLNAALWTARTTAEGGTGDLFVTTNRSDGARNVGHLFQTNYVTRAMVGLFGSDRFRVSVSPNGTDFQDALVVDDATGIAELPRLPRFKAYTNYDNAGLLNQWKKIGINVAESNDQGAFDPANNWFKAPVAGAYVFGATVLHKDRTAGTPRLRARLVRNGTTEIRGSFSELTGTPVSLASALSVQTMTVLAKDETVELQGFYAGTDGSFAADHTSFWGYKVG